MKTGFKRLQALMGENEALAPIVARQKKLAHLQHVLAGALPSGWETFCRVANLEGSTLVVAVANGAIATNLKAVLPRLVGAFRAEVPGAETPQRSESRSAGMERVERHRREGGEAGAAEAAPCSPRPPSLRPRVEQKVQKTNKEQEVTAIRLIVQPDFFLSASPPARGSRPGAGGVAISDRQLADLARKLGDSPLKKTVEKTLSSRKRGVKASTD